MKEVFIVFALAIAALYQAFAYFPYTSSAVAAVLIFLAAKLWQRHHAAELQREAAELQREANAAEASRQRQARMRWEAEQREINLMAKYGDAAIVRGIIRGEYWEGMTEDQLTDSLGEPLEVASDVSRTRTKQVFKYGRSTRGFRLHITLVNGEVTRWKQQ